MGREPELVEQLGEFDVMQAFHEGEWSILSEVAEKFSEM